MNCAIAAFVVLVFIAIGVRSADSSDETNESPSVAEMAQIMGDDASAEDLMALLAEERVRFLWSFLHRVAEFGDATRPQAH